MYKYEYKIEAAGSSGFHFGAREIVDYYKKNYSKANKFCITPSISYLPDLNIRFFNHGLKKIQICLPSSNSDNEVESNVLYAVGPNEVDLSNFMIVKVIFYPNLKDVAFFIIKRKY